MSADNNTHTETETETIKVSVKVIRHVIFLFSALFAGAGGSIAVRGINPPFYDSATGSDLREISDEFKAEINILKIQMGSLVDFTEELEDKLPTNFPPLEWQTWRTGLTAELLAVKLDDRNIKEDIRGLEERCIEHNAEAEDWKRQILQNKDGVDTLWNWVKTK